MDSSLKWWQTFFILILVITNEVYLRLEVKQKKYSELTFDHGNGNVH